MSARLIPLLVFVVLGGFLLVGLSLNPREVPSPLIDQPAAPFELAQLHEPTKTLGVDDMRGQVWLLNMWASWCVSWRVEHPLLVELTKTKAVPIVGLNYKDKPDEGKVRFAQLGNPYNVSVMDRDGRVGIDFGVYVAPETFVIDKSGTIRHKHNGPVTVDSLEKKILPMVRQLQQS